MLICCSQFEHFFFTHFALIYSHLEELRLAVDDNLHSVNFKKTDWPEFHANTRKVWNTGSCTGLSYTFRRHLTNSHSIFSPSTTVQGLRLVNT